MKSVFNLLVGFLLFSASVFAQDVHKWTLTEMIDYAIENNISIKQSELTLKSTTANYKQAKNNKLPSITGSTSYQLSNGSSIDQITNSWSSNMTNTNNFGVSANWTLYQGNQLNLRQDKGELQLQENELYVEEAKNNISLSVLEAYINAIYAHEAITVSENTLTSSASQLKQAQVKFNSGDIPKSDLADIETQHATNQAEAVSAQQNYQLKVLALKQLLELEPEVDFNIEIITATTQHIIPNKEIVFAKAVEVLPTLKVYDNLKEQAEKDLAISKTGFLPTVSLSAGVNTGYTDNINYSYANQLSNNVGQNVGIGISIPIFSKNQNKTNVAVAKIDLEQSDLNKIQAGKSLYANIETVWQNAISSQAQQQASEIARNNAKTAYELAIKKYEFGGLTPADLLVSRNAYLNAEQNYLQNKYMALLYQQLLKYYQGENVADLI
ncbi:MAG: TolC family protein [Flavobacteriaceae bacterium]